GVAGSIVASVGLMFAPLCILLVLATLYAELAQYDIVRRAAHGVSVGAAGLILAMALKMGHPLRNSGWRIAIALASFAAIGLARLPLLWVLAALGPVAFALAWRYR